MLAHFWRGTMSPRALAAVCVCAAILSSPSATVAAAEPAGAGAAQFATVLAEEARSQAKCESIEGRIFVATKGLSECIATYVTPGFEDKSWAVLFFDGDSSKEIYAKPEDFKQHVLKRQHELLQRWSKKMKVRYVYVSRVGLMGSSGNHGNRRKPDETYIMNAAVDLIKERLGLDRVVIAGQSGGSTIAALLLTLGRTDVTCAVLGSGAFDLVNMRQENLKRLGRKVNKSGLSKVMLDPSARVERIPHDPARRIFVIGDPSDVRTPWAQQAAFAAALQSSGHHAVLAAMDAKGEHDHVATRMVVPAAGACGNGHADAKIIKALTPQNSLQQPVKSAQLHD